MCSVAGWYPTLWEPIDCRPPGSSVHGILQARILEWVVIPFVRGSSWPRDRTPASSISFTGRWILYHWGLLLLFSHSVVHDSWRSPGLQHARPPCPSLFRSSPKFKFWSPAGGIFLMIPCATRSKGKPEDKVCGIPLCPLILARECTGAGALWAGLCLRRVLPAGKSSPSVGEQWHAPLLFSCRGGCHWKLERGKALFLPSLPSCIWLLFQPPLSLQTCVQSWPHSLTFSPTY